MPTAEVAAVLGVQPGAGLSTPEVAERRARYGPNRLREPAREPGWHMFLRQFADLLIALLVVAAVVAAVVSRSWETPVAISVAVLFNAVLGYVQESRARASVAALRGMLDATASVLRDGLVCQVSAADLVPGDVVLLAAGDRVPADGRLLEAARFAAQEAALTGESAPVEKSTGPVDDADAPLAERSGMVFMNTVVSRGRGRMVVTATGMGTEIGQVASLLEDAQQLRTPLQRQVDQLGRTISGLAGAVIVFVFVVGLIQGRSAADLFLTAVALAVAAIPEGLPAVVAFTLAMGTARLARHNAIVKGLSSVETLGETTHVCTDKTGTLTRNEMTAQAVVLDGRTLSVTGAGYGPDGDVLGADGCPVPLPDVATEVMALCSDATVRDGELVGDPTEGALVVLAAKSGTDVEHLRRARPRLAEVPFDASYKLMATFHAWPAVTGRPADGADPGGGAARRTRCLAKGAPDAVLARAHSALGVDGTAAPLDDEARQRWSTANRDLGAQGLRVMALAYRDLGTHLLGDAANLMDHVDGLVLVGLVGILDPPRPAAAEALAACRQAGIRVRMVTGDHATTATAIAERLGIDGDVLSGRDLDGMDDAALAARIDNLGVVARVSPHHKIRLVRVLQSRGDVVAMTGDGVNDAPALSMADIGVAMGASGTDVARDAATMVLTDDDFATIVTAVREGRAIYHNIVNFVKFQLTTACAFVAIFVVAGIFGIAGGIPFTAVQILWVNVIMDGPPAMSLGVDPPAADTMRRPPRRAGDRILTARRFARIALLAGVMTAGTVAVIRLAPGDRPSFDEATVAGTLAFTTFVLFQVFNLLNLRSDTGSVFSAGTFANRAALVAVVAVVAMQAALVSVPFLQGVFHTVPLGWREWALAVAVASSVLWVEELRKMVARARGGRPGRSGEQ